LVNKLKRETSLPQIKAVITDYVGTLTNARCYTMEASMDKLHSALVQAGFETEKQQFLDAYSKAHEKYRAIRYCEFREVTNSVWVAEALGILGFDVGSNDSRMKMALNVFFKDYVDSLELRPYAERLLKKASEPYKLGLISNFTYAPVVYASLRQLGISHFFNAIVVSGEFGWRKPHEKIFSDALQRLRIRPEEAVYIGDCPLEDIKGGLNAGVRTIFVSSQFYKIEDLVTSGLKPAFIAEDLKEVYENFEKISNLI
jgi:putative hydrolase of the HAD superfamily